MNSLPFAIAHTGVPPIKCQGIKTKLVPFLFSSVQWDAGERGRWIEPFLGSGVAAFNLAPDRALLTDTNQHIIRFYQAVQSGEINREAAQEILVCEGKKLEIGGADYYYEVRQRFNTNASSFDFLFLNRCCFNGVMRFNRKGGFNVPFGHKPMRFSKAYITKIVNQIGWAAKQMQGKAWEFRTASWEETLSEVQAGDFVYADPPYIGRHTDYYNAWSDADAIELSCRAATLPCGFALSMWLENRYRKNAHIAEHWSEWEMRVCSHFYHVGASEDLRNAMEEALLIKLGYAADVSVNTPHRTAIKPTQLSMVIEQKPLYLPCKAK